MRSRSAIVLALVALAAVAPADTAPLTATNPIGTPRWLPSAANERADVPSWADRLVVVYDQSLTEDGSAAPLLARGRFTARFSTPMPGGTSANYTSPRVTPVVEGTVGGFAGRVAGFLTDFALATLQGDVRDGSCDKLGTSAFSYAYSTTRTVTGAAYTPQPCERIDRVRALDDGTYETTVTTFTPGFWIDVGFWLFSSSTPDDLVEVSYQAAYESRGDGSGLPDSVGFSTETTGRPSITDPPPPPPPPPPPVRTPHATFTIDATPGAFGKPCPDFVYVIAVLEGAVDGSWDDRTVEVPATARSVEFAMRPTAGLWSYRVIDPIGRTSDAYSSAEFQSPPRTVPSSGYGQIPTLVPGSFTLRACNIAGEPNATIDVYID